MRSPGTTLPMSQQQYGGSVGGPIRRGSTFYFVNAEQRAARSDRLHDHQPGHRRRHQRAAGGGRLPRRSASPPATIRIPVDSLNLFGKVDHAFSGRDQLSVRYSLYDVASDNSRGAGGLSAPSGSSWLDNRDQAVVGQQHADPRRPHRQRDPRAVHPQRPAGAADRPGRPDREHRRCRHLRHLRLESAGPAQQDVPVRRHARPAARRARAARRRRPRSTTTTRIVFPRTVRGSYTFSSLANFLAGTYNNAGFTQTFGDSQSSARATPTSGCTCRTSGAPRRGLTLNLGLRYDLQWLETIDTDANNLSPRVGFAWTPFEARDLVVRGSAGLYFDRVPLRAAGQRAAVGRQHHRPGAAAAAEHRA